MRKFSVRALFDNLRAVINNQYENILNKIAKHSTAYKELLVEHNDLLSLNKNLPLIRQIVEFSNTNRLFNKLLFMSALNNTNEFDVVAIRNSEPNDLIIAKDDFEKHMIQQEMKFFTGSGQVVTLDELDNPTTKIRIPIGRVFVKSSIWLTDMSKYNNLLYLIIEDRNKQLQEMTR